MCLERVTETIKNPVSLIQSGWKSFDGTKAAPMFQAYPYKGTKLVPLDQWITAQGDKISGSDAYKPGFHVYEDEKQMEKETNKRRVYYRNVHARGTQDRKTVVVAQQIYVPSDPDAWPPRNQ